MRNLENVEVGTEVAYVRRFGWRLADIQVTKGVVEKVTKTQITALNGRRFNKRTGLELGHKGSRFHADPCLEVVTHELLEEIAKATATKAAFAKCRAWGERLHGLRAVDAVELAALLPDLPASEEK